jgi:hypothetical protein
MKQNGTSVALKYGDFISAPQIETPAFGGATYTATALTALSRASSICGQAVDDAAAAHRTKVAAEAAQAPHLRRVISVFVAFVKATFGNSPDALADFGISPRKARTPLTAEQKAAAVAKARGKAGGATHDGRESEEECRLWRPFFSL